MRPEHQEILKEYARRIEQGSYAAFIDGSVNTNLAYKPEFVSNNYKTGKKVLSTVESELLHCDAFFISVAFITLGGITPLLQTLAELEERKIPVPLNIGGYKYDPKTKTFPVFVNYMKYESVSATQRYEDEFTAPDRLTAISKSGRTLASEDVQNFLRCEERGIAVHLFIRKNKDDKVSKEFYYLGRMFPDGTLKPEEFVLPGTDKTAVRMYWKLDVPVREDLYEYLTEEEL